jgi:MFS transporter, MHS family, proline/betaine transporter
LIVSIYPVFMLISSPTENIGYAALGVLLLALLASAICAPAYPYAIKSFEVELRFSGVASSWNLGNALLGGTTPAICTALVNWLETPLAPAFYLVTVSVALLVVKYFATQEHNLHIDK